MDVRTESERPFCSLVPLEVDLTGREQERSKKPRLKKLPATPALSATPQLETRSLALPSEKHLTTTPQWSSFVWGTHSKWGFKTFRMANHSQDERPWRVRLSQRGELPLPFLCLWFWLFLFVSFSAGRQGRRAGRQLCLKVQSDPSAGLMLCSDISSSTISLLFDVGDAQGRIVISCCQKFCEGTETGAELQWPTCLWLIKTEYIKPNNTDKSQWTRSLKTHVNLMSSPQGCRWNLSSYLRSTSQPPKPVHPLNLINLHTERHIYSASVCTL